MATPSPGVGCPLCVFGGGCRFLRWPQAGPSITFGAYEAMETVGFQWNAFGRRATWAGHYKAVTILPFGRNIFLTWLCFHSHRLPSRRPTTPLKSHENSKHSPECSLELPRRSFCCRSAPPAASAAAAARCRLAGASASSASREGDRRGRAPWKGAPRFDCD